MNTHSLAQTRCVIFDLDGTLVDSAPDIFTSINLTLVELGLPTCSLAHVRNWIGNGANCLIKRALTGQTDGEPKEALFVRARELFLDYYAQRVCEDSFIFPGVIEGLNELHAQSYTLACVTNKPRRFVPPLMKELEIDHFFKYVNCGDDLHVKKPDPLPLLQIIEKEGIEPSQALMVGDSESDIKAAQAAKITSFCLRYGYHQGKGVDALGADYIIDSITEIANYIQQAA